MRMQKVATCMVCATALVACGGTEQGPLQPSGPNTFQVLASSTTDTIGAVLPPLRVQALAGNAKPRSGAAITFSLVAAGSGSPTGIILPGIGPEGSVTITTGADGIAATPVSFDERAGSYGLRIAEVGITRVDTVHFEIKPGNATHLDLTTRDTMTTVGSGYTPTIGVLDRKDNPRPDSPTLTAPSAACGISGSRITGVAIGNCTVSVQVSGLRDSIVMAVVPNVAILATADGPVLGQYLLTMNLDGSGVKYVRILPYGSGRAFHPIKVAAVPLVAVQHLGSDQRLHVFLVDSLGNERALAPQGLPPNSDDNWPSISPDGQWIYFSSRNDPNLATRVWRAHLDGTSASVLTPIEASFGWFSNFPEISADGKTLAYANQGLQLRLMDLATGQISAPPVTSVGYIRAHPKLARFATMDITNYRIVTDATGTRTVADSVASHLEYLPDGQWILTQNVSFLPGGVIKTGDRVILNELTGQRIRIKYSMPIRELAVIR